ncbi:MAG: DNA photolyase [Proteobacteria bacterium]|nr:DNA photolyase [Pseudomonadota bacterium]MBU1736589.1 DNA photolyase [Pseudomonadota bacterium]
MTKRNHSLNSGLIDPATLLREILVEESASGYPLAREILARAGKIPFKVVPDGYNPMAADEKKSRTDFTGNLNRGKNILLLTINRGRFFKPCPATREYRCCDYQVLNIGMNCPMDCVYCILQSYLNNPWLSFFVNTDDLLNEMEAAFRAEPERLWRIGTGEFTDSMALDSLTGLSGILIDFMKDKENAVLELKTKSAYIENLKGLDHGGRTILAWSLNSPPIMGREELKTASLNQRLDAAAECAALGYRLAFHFDPIIHHPGWQDGYCSTIQTLYAKVPAESIVWISMGCLRYIPKLKEIATDRFPKSRFFYDEFVMGLDGKSRYFRTQRTEMYKQIYSELKRFAAESTCIYLCMESDEIWQEVFGYTPSEHSTLPTMLDRAAGLQNS